MTNTRTSVARFGLCALLIPALLPALPAAYGANVPPAQLTSSLHWRSVGPFVGGRVVAVSGVAQQPNLYYMGAVGGGVWKSENYGSTWENISDKYFDSSNIGALAVAPSDPKVIYAGTGESDIRNTFLTGDGMYKSTDGGKTWTHIGLEKTEVISWIIIDPINPDVVYVAALGHVWASNPERGVYKSSDGGKTWTKILYVNDKTGAMTLAMDPSNPQVLYATMWEAYRRPWTLSSGGPGSGIYKSTDGGATWTNLTHNPGLPTGIFGKVGIAVAPSNPGIVYALIQANYRGQAGGLFRSDNGGQSWTLINNSMRITQRAFYYSQVYVDPKDPNTIYLPNVEVFVSHDGGKTLVQLHPPHGDNHAFWINPNNPEIFIEGNDGGATITQDGGKTWSQEHNQPTGQFYHVNLDDQFPFHIYGAQQDEGSTEGPSAVAFGGIPTTAWKDVRGGESSWVVPQPGSPWVTYASGYYAVMHRDDRRAGVVQSITPSPIYRDGAAASELQYRFGWIHHPILFAPGNPQELLIGAQYVLRSLDHGTTWTEISPDLTRNDKSTEGRPGGPISADVSGAEVYPSISAMDVSPINDSIIWTGSDDGLVYVTTDNGGHWNAVRPKDLPAWSTVTCIEASHTDPGTAYLTASRYQWDDFKPYVYMTTDYGKHWTALDQNLPADQYLESIRQDPNDPGLLFLGTSKTVFVSFDGGSHWTPLTLDLPAVRVSDIAIQPAQHAVVLATHGRAFWVLDNLQFLEQLGKAQVDSTQPYVFAPQQAWLVKRSTGSFTRPGEGENRAAGATVFFQLPANYDGHTQVTLSFTAADGTLIRSFTLPVQPKKTENGKPPKPVKLRPGMNRFQWDLRYPDATEVTGFHPPDVDEGYDDQLTGPEVLPGSYFAVLDYGGTLSKQPFTVRLDPRLTTTPEQLQVRFNLLMQIHTTLDQLDSKLNQAIDARSALQKAVTNQKISARQAKAALAALDRDIGDLVQLKIQSSEGDIVYEPKLRSHLALLANDIEINFTPLRQVSQQGFAILSAQASAGEARLQADIQEANRLLGN
ncbi:MAG: glycosyl hydrolase [Gammaproteobacteria bacterium]|nr:glycosyl hydrolase [Gammaproteobacteria bacterium]